MVQANILNTTKPKAWGLCLVYVTHSCIFKRTAPCQVGFWRVFGMGTPALPFLLCSSQFLWLPCRPIFCPFPSIPTFQSGPTCHGLLSHNTKNLSTGLGSCKLSHLSCFSSRWPHRERKALVCWRMTGWMWMNNSTLAFRPTHITSLCVTCSFNPAISRVLCWKSLFFLSVVSLTVLAFHLILSF